MDLTLPACPAAEPPRSAGASCAERSSRSGGLGRLASVEHGSEHALNATRNAMLQALERFGGVVVFATNHIAHYDPAFHRRIPTQAAFALPDAPCREAYARRLLATPIPRADDVTPAWIAESTDGLSQAEMLNALVNAAARAVVRAGPERRVARDDLAASIATIRAHGAAMEGRAPPRVERDDVTERVRLAARLPLRRGATGRR